MAITAGQKGRASDFIQGSEANATPASDEGKVPQLESDGRISPIFVRNGFGDGSDGDVTISTPTSLSRNMYYNNLTVNDNLNTAGYAIYVKNKIDGSGKVYWNGNNGSNGSPPPSCDTSSSCNSVNVGGGSGGGAVTGYFRNIAGGNGGAAEGCSGGFGGVSGAAVLSSLGSAGVAGGSGGNSPNGSSSGGGGGSGGAVTAPKVKLGLVRWLTFLAMDIDTSVSLSTSTEENTGGEVNDFAAHSHTLPITVGMRVLGGPAGAGGGGAGGSNTTGGNRASGSGAGAGASGGLVFIAARIWAGTFEIEARGGTGGNGGSTSCSGGSAGGGGGGGNGGVSIVVYERKTWTGSYDLAAGTGGTGGTATGGGNNGAAGTNGTAGTSYEIFIGDTM